jgi:four helix bundle protein
MAFDAFEVALAMVRSLREPVRRIREADAALADQVRRAAQSVPLNVAEARKRVGRDRVHLWRVAAGSAAEVRAALRVAVAWGYVRDAEVAEALGLLDRQCAMLWRLTAR